MATRRIAVVLAAGVVAVGLSAWARAVPRRHVVEIRGMAFHPDSVTVRVGDTVVWVNQDIVPHTATAKSGWDTGQLANGATGTYVVQKSGVESYFCRLHPVMVGWIVVRGYRP
jgi:plastocyanin